MGFRCGVSAILGPSGGIERQSLLTSCDTRHGCSRGPFVATNPRAPEPTAKEILSHEIDLSALGTVRNTWKSPLGTTFSCLIFNISVKSLQNLLRSLTSSTCIVQKESLPKLNKQAEIQGLAWPVRLSWSSQRPPALVTTSLFYNTPTSVFWGCRSRQRQRFPKAG